MLNLTMINDESLIFTHAHCRSSWIGDFSITLKPFSVSLPCWYKSVGILLFWLSMTIYVLGEHTKGYKEGFDTGIKQCIKILDRNCYSKEINNDETVQNQ